MQKTGGKPSVERAHFSSIDNERAVLGIVLKNNAVLDDFSDLAGSFGTGIFYHQRHRDLFDCINIVYENGGRADVVTVLPLMVARAYEEEGAREYIVNLAVNAPPGDRFASYMKVLRELSIERILYDKLEEGKKFLFGEASVVDKLAMADRLVSEARDQVVSRDGSVKTIREACRELAQHIEKMTESSCELMGISCGFEELDRKLSGLVPQDMLIVAARPSMGKTALAMAMAEHVATSASQHKVHVFSLEMSARSLAARMVSSAANLPMKKVMQAKLHTDEDWMRLNSGISRLIENDNILIDETSGIHIDEIRARARKAKREFGTTLIIVDYLQIITSSARSETEQITDISKKLKGIAKELNVPIVVLSQLSRGVERREDKRPMMSDLRGSGAIEQDADVIMFIYRDDYYNPDSEMKGTAEIIIAKHRQGEVGVVLLDFDAEKTAFRNRPTY